MMRHRSKDVCSAVHLRMSGGRPGWSVLSVAALALYALAITQAICIGHKWRMQLLHRGIAVDFTHQRVCATNDAPRRQEPVAVDVAIARPKAGIAPAELAASKSLRGILSSVDDAQQDPLRHVASFVIQKQALADVA